MNPITKLEQMTLQQKLKLFCGGLAAIFIGIMVTTLALNLLINAQVSAPSERSQAGLTKSEASTQRILTSRTAVDSSSKEMDELAVQISKLNQTVQLVSRKTNGVASDLDTFAEDLEGLLDYLPEGDALYEAEDLVDSVDDIKSVLSREAIISLRQMQQDLSAFSSQLQREAGGQAGRIR